MDGQECFLKEHLTCNAKNGGIVVSAQRLRTASLDRGDGLHKQLSQEADAQYWCHRCCIASYASKFHIMRSNLSKAEDAEDAEEEPPAKRSRRSDQDKFNFKEHCYICGKMCTALDPRHPERYRPFSCCTTTDRRKAIILDTCDKRNDELGNQVRLRIQGTVSDLHAVGAMYHRDCMRSFKCNFTSRCESEDDSGSTSTIVSNDEAFDKVHDCMMIDKARIWNTVELHELYTMYGGKVMSRRLLVNNLLEKHRPDLLILSGVGVANMLVFRSEAPKYMRIAANNHDDIETAIGIVANTIVSECKELKRDQSKYDTHINLDGALASSSPTMLNLLSSISPKLEDNLPAALAGNIVTSVVTNTPTFLQIAIGVVVREKSNIDLLHKFGVTSSYDEVRRYKSSAAHAASECKEKQGLSNSEAGLIQVVADNFDTSISSPNGMKATHALAMLLTQPQKPSVQSKGDKIKRVKKTEMSEKNLPDVPIHVYDGPRKPNMPTNVANRTPLPLRVLVSQHISNARASENDLQFLTDVTSVENTPEFGGYNTKLAREQGHATKDRTKAVYLPLVDMTPAEPTTILTAMIEAQRLTNATGQTYTIFTTDQQLYRVVVNISWVYSDLFIDFIPRLGGMHTLMSFVGAIGTLMADTGLEQVMNVAFGGVPKMLSGKKYPQKVRALCMVVEELLRGTITTGAFQNYTDLVTTLELQSSQSRTSKLWVDNLIKPVLIILLFIRAEREADWPLHLQATQMMIPYFFSSGHFNYARYCLYYLRSMAKLPAAILDEFMKGNHVMRHQRGIWNGLWSDLYIESTFMRYGHSPGGIVGITLQPSTMKRWALSLHICAQLKKDVLSLGSYDSQTTITTHKEEGASRIISDSNDRKKIRTKLVTCIDPLNHASHSPDSLVNIVTGQIAPTSVNVDQSIVLGTDLMRSYEDGWPHSFHKVLTKPTVNMTLSRKKVNVGNVGVYDMSLIFSRVMFLQKVRDIDMKDVLSYEIAGVPPSMFDENGDMRLTKSKATLKTKLQVEFTDRRSLSPDSILIDGCAILWVVRWPAHGLVQDYVSAFVDYIVSHLRIADTYLIFDRYYDNSIKDITRTARAGKNASRQHQLSMTTPLPPQNVCLTVTQNKVQLINHICEYLRVTCDRLPQNGKSLVVTGGQPTPVQLCDGTVTEKPDLRTQHEEADVIIAQQAVYLANDGKESIRVIADDTDVFVLLLHYYKLLHLTCSMVMVATSSSRKCSDVKATADKHSQIVTNVLAAHVLTGCDSVSSIWGLGKGTVLKVLKSGRVTLNKLGNPQEDSADVIAQCIAFIAACYGYPQETDMTSLRFRVWTSKMSNHKLSQSPKLRALPPTKEAFIQHVLRAHLQTAIWRCALNGNPPALNPVHYGWTLNTHSKKLEPVTLPADIPLAPESVLKMIKCSCASAEPCSTARCSCSAARISCSIFCSCHGDDCRNPQTIIDIHEDGGDDDGEGYGAEEDEQ